MMESNTEITNSNCANPMDPLRFWIVGLMDTASPLDYWIVGHASLWIVGQIMVNHLTIQQSNSPTIQLLTHLFLSQ